MSTSKRYEKKDFLNGKIKNSKVIASISDDLRKQDFEALIKSPNGGKIFWRIELSVKTWRSFILASEESIKLKKELAELKKLNDQLEKNNKILMEAIEKDSEPFEFNKSQPSYLNIAEDKALIVRGPTMQGGLPSLGKRR